MLREGRLNLVLEPREFRILDGLRLNPRKSFTGRVRGERLTRKKGVSIEFADYRDYSEGDDLRHLDWNVLARLDSAVMRTYQDEEDLAVHLLVDASESMSFGEPSKVSLAARLACAIGYVALNAGDAVYPRSVGASEKPIPPLRGRASYPRLGAWSQSPGEPKHGLSAALRAFAASSTRTGLVVLMSDGLDPDISSAMRILGGRGHEVWFVQILSDAELDPDLEGDLRLIDSEAGVPVELTVNSFALKEYRRRLDAHNAGLAESVRRIGGRHCVVTNDWQIDRFLRGVMKKDRWVA